MLDRLLSRRNSLPRMVNRLVDELADRPMSLLGRLAALRHGRPSPDDVTRILEAQPGRRATILIGPVNYAAQGHEWARALADADDEVQAVNMAVDVPGGFDFAADAIIPQPVYHNGREWQRRQREAARRFSHVMIEAEEPLFGRLLGREVSAEIADLRDHGVSVALMAHGTDARRPTAHRGRTPWSPYLDPELYIDRLETLSARNIALLENAGCPVFVSTPDLLLDVPSAVWCPVVVDPHRWATPDGPKSRGPLRVVHAPSSALIKGTHLVEPVLWDLHERGVIEYRPVSGMPTDRMAEVFAGADIVLDQFRLGSYGVAACEAMSAGRLVMGHVMQEVRDVVTAVTGMELPIMEATPDTVEERLLWVADHREELGVHRQQGIDFIRRVHDGHFSSAVLLENWIDRDSGLRPAERK